MSHQLPYGPTPEDRPAIQATIEPGTPKPTLPPYAISQRDGKPRLGYPRVMRYSFTALLMHHD